MGRNPMRHNGFPPANYDPRTVDVMRNPAPRKLSTRILAIGCTLAALLLVMLLWCIGIPTTADLK